MCLNETISQVSKGKSFTIFITEQLFLSMAKTPGWLQGSLTAVYSECAQEAGAASHIHLPWTCVVGQNYFLPQHKHCTKISVNGFGLSIAQFPWIFPIARDVLSQHQKQDITQSMCFGKTEFPFHFSYCAATFSLKVFWLTSIWIQMAY